MMWRPYLWGDREVVDGRPLKVEYVPTTITLVDEQGEIAAVAGLMPRAPGNFEVFLVPAGACVPSFAVYRALKRKFEEFSKAEGVYRLFAMVDPQTEGGEELAAAMGMKFEAFLPAWWEGCGRIMMGRVCN